MSKPLKKKKFFKFDDVQVAAVDVDQTNKATNTATATATSGSVTTGDIWLKGKADLVIYTGDASATASASSTQSNTVGDISITQSADDLLV